MSSFAFATIISFDAYFFGEEEINDGGNVNTRVATMAAAARALSILPLMAKGSCRTPKHTKNKAAAIVAVMTGRNLSPELCVSVLIIRMTARTRAATIAKKSMMPGRESGYCLSAASHVSLAGVGFVSLWSVLVV